MTTTHPHSKDETMRITTTNLTAKPASEKQRAFISSLAAKRDWSRLFDNTTAMIVTDVANGGEVDSREASFAIESLLACPHLERTAAVTNAVTEAGMYLKGEQAFKVQKSGSGNLYAKELVQTAPDRWAFEYAPGAMRKLSSDNKMTLEQAAAWGTRYGWCCNCGKELSDPKSIAAGIGPVCAKRF